MLSFYRFADKYKLPRQPAKAKTDPNERIISPADPHTYLSKELIQEAINSKHDGPQLARVLQCLAFVVMIPSPRDHAPATHLPGMGCSRSLV